MIPTHCDLPMIRDKRYKIMELYRCAACTASISVPKGYFDDEEETVTKLPMCEVCNAILPRSASNRYRRPRRYCSSACRQQAFRQRRRSEQVAEEVSA